MKVEYYECNTKAGACVRWRIVREGKVIAQGKTDHRSTGECQYEINEIIEHIESVARGRSTYGDE